MQHYAGYWLRGMLYRINMGISGPHCWCADKISRCGYWQKIGQATAREDNQSCHILRVLFNRIESVFFMYIDIEESFNYLLMRKLPQNWIWSFPYLLSWWPSALLDLLVKKRLLVFLLQEHARVILETNYTPHPFFFGKRVDVLNNLAQDIPCSCGCWSHTPHWLHYQASSWLQRSTYYWIQAQAKGYGLWDMGYVLQNIGYRLQVMYGDKLSTLLACIQHIMMCWLSKIWPGY